MCGTGCGHLPEDEGHHFFSFLARSVAVFFSQRPQSFFSLAVYFLPYYSLFPGGVLLLLVVMLVPTGCTYGKSTNKVVEYLS